MTTETILDLWWTVTSVWLTCVGFLALLGAFATPIALADSSIATKTAAARYALVVTTLAVSGILWPLAAPVLVVGVLMWSLRNADLELNVKRPLPRAVRKEMKRKYDLARADMILNSALREAEQDFERKLSA